MKLLTKIFLPLVIASTAVGCTQYTAIAQAPDNKVFVTKTTSYIIWTSNKMLLCNWAGNAASGCVEVTQN